MSCLWLVAILSISLGGLAWWRAIELRRKSGLPAGRVIYADTHSHNWRPAPRPFFSARFGLVGKPDYLVETGQGLIPVEVKSGSAPDVPYLGHILQVAAYCLLVEDSTGKPSPHGWLQYANALFEIDFTRELQQELLNNLAEMRQLRNKKTVARSHNQPGRCSTCRFNEQCGEAIGQATD
jgi:CRISPR-associated exonuclease Cas4